MPDSSLRRTPRGRTPLFRALVCLAAASLPLWSLSGCREGETPGADPADGGSAEAETTDVRAGFATDVAEALERLGPTLEREAWPGFRPDTLPLLLVLPGEGSLLVGWPGRNASGATEAPAGPGGLHPGGFRPLDGHPSLLWREGTDGSEASTVVALDDRAVAQVVVPPGRPVLRAVEGAVHEGFHLIQWSRAAEGRRFGRPENAFLVTRYPVLDPELETGWAREGILLARALRAGSPSEAAREAAAFLEVRSARQRTLGQDLAAFDLDAELNEGLAEYAGLLGRLLHETDRDAAAARERLAELLADRLEEPGDRIQAPLRSRYYASGAAQALLLDRLAGPDWKAALEAEDLTLTGALARALAETLTPPAQGALAVDGPSPWLASAESAEELPVQVAGELAQLRRNREARVEATFRMAGWTLVLSPMELRSRFDLCGFDPQNLIRISEGVLLHTRWFRPCLDGVLDADLQAPVLQDTTSGELQVAIRGGTIELRSSGRTFELPGHREEFRVRDLEITAEGVTVRSPGAILFREGAVLHVSPLPRELRPPG
jgi:hypothetical protein